MFRFIDLSLQKWTVSKNRKPLLLRGARQVGKTYAVRKLGQSFSEFVEVNFEVSPQLRKIFNEGNELDPIKIIRDLSIALNKDIIPGKTLLFFDEIQVVPNAITTLRYFYEIIPELHVIAAGSLIEFAIQKVGIPVGRIEFLYLYPMSWLEFLKALGQEHIITAILSHDINVPETDVVHEKVMELLREYFAIGGMPEAVKYWVETKDPKICSKIHQSIIQSYRQDFFKYAKLYQVKYVELIFEESLQQLGKKFKFRQLEGGYRKRELSPALDLLEHAGVVYRVRLASGHGVPIGADVNHEHYKLIFLDIGLSQALLGFDLSDWFLNGMPAFVNKGNIVEAFVGQELLAYADPSLKTLLYYWHRESKNSNAEVDYLLQAGGHIIPIEVKSGKGNYLKSLQIFLESHPKSEYGVRFSTRNYLNQSNLKSYPLYAVAAIMKKQFTVQELLEAKTNV